MSLQLSKKLRASDHQDPLTQKFLLDCSFATYQMTQTSDCVKNIGECDDGYNAPILNPVTCSQYIERLATNDSLDINDEMLDELFKENKNEKTSELQEKSREISIELAANSSKDESERKKSKNLNNSYREYLSPVSSSPFLSLGSFFGLTKHHKKFILKTKNIASLYDWQEECLRLKAIHNRTNLIYALPTSGGKTLVAEIAMLREIILRKKNVIFVLPYVSIAQEKVQDLMPFAAEFNFMVEEYCAGKGSIPPMRRRKKNTIYVCTIEKSQILFDSLYESKRLKEVGLIVVDELHMVGDTQRGYNLETLLTKTMFNQQSSIQILGMSATISNLSQLASFLRADIYTRDFRPVELKEFVKIGPEILSIDPNAFLADAFKVERRVGDDYPPTISKRDSDHVAALVLEVIPKSSCLIFCATKQNCESVATLLADVLPKELRDFKRDDKMNVIDAIKEDSGGHICPILARTIPFGVAYHHSGLTSDERKHLEEAFRLNIICIICCTSTLAAGVNLPAQRVIIRSPYVGPHFLTLSRYKQMIGRAGRAGKCNTGESIMICSPQDHAKLTNLLCSKMDETQSAFLQEKSGQLLRTVVLNLLGTKLVKSIDELVQFFKCSLLYVQVGRIEMIRERMVASVKLLMEEGALTFVTATSGRRYASFEIMWNGKNEEVFPDDVLDVSKIGKAAVNAGIGLEEARKIECDLRKVNQSFVMTQSLHLLYIVVPLDSLNSINLDYKHFNEIFMQLDPTLMHTARVIGISESLAMRLITRPSAVKENDKFMIKRFYAALILNDIWNSKETFEVARTYKINRGVAGSIMSSASSRSYSIFKFCEVHDEFQIFRDCLEKFSKRLAYCCSDELLPLMELPNVKIVRIIRNLSKLRQNFLFFF